MADNGAAGNVLHLTRTRAADGGDPGDVVVVSADNLIPADGVVLETRDLLVSQAVLTGEVFPVEKRPGVVAATAEIAERSNCDFMGTSVRSGTARLLVVRTGEATAYGSIARRLNAIENFGRMDVLCTDKTGTLTVGAMALELAADVDGKASDSIFRAGWINASLQQGLANPLDEAIVAEALRRGTPIAAARKLDEIPYDFVRRRLSVVVAEGDGALLVSKGAFANVLEACSQVRGPNGVAVLDAALRAALEARFAG